MDPTYPFFPIASIISAFLLVLLLVTSAFRRSWNFGIFMICIGLLCEDLAFGVNSIIWADNADLKHYVWCDIAIRVSLKSCKPASHVQLFGAIVVPAALYVGLFYPWSRWLHECDIWLWDVSSATGSAHRNPPNNLCAILLPTNYFRLLAIGCLDIVLTLPIACIGLFLDTRSSNNFVFYPGWDVVHSNFAPFSVPEEVWRTADFWPIFTIYFTPWYNVVLSLAIVAIFGTSAEAWDVYRHSYHAVTARLGFRSNAESNSTLSALVFKRNYDQEYAISFFPYLLSGLLISPPKHVYGSAFGKLFRWRRHSTAKSDFSVIKLRKPWDGSEAGKSTLSGVLVSGDNEVAWMTMYHFDSPDLSRFLIAGLSGQETANYIAQERRSMIPQPRSQDGVLAFLREVVHVRQAQRKRTIYGELPTKCSFMAGKPQQDAHSETQHRAC
ncbi:hypothetical protein K488DRAFT_69261 [Vararia minispora EC-137]|uniref:Uncharacterized protein n=1 Tax=Vararia minispora EC-137 TaxID=1314806 RepID=A0ACB8QR24_9AGAM|nr:hypothetical protein K488DRAFT_69261 [Vararia minispora EC-137]